MLSCVQLIGSIKPTSRSMNIDDSYISLRDLAQYVNLDTPYLDNAINHYIHHKLLHF